MTKTEKTYTLITGASTGLGKQFAHECARRKMNLILVSLPNEDLDMLSKELSLTYHVKVFYKEIDLTEQATILNFTKWVTSNFAVNILINNAGIGGTELFIDSKMDYLDNMIQLNIRAMIMLTRLILPELEKHSNAYILNVSSLAAFSPVPYKTIYPATKAFIHHFSRGLKAELKDTNVKVSVLNPGPIMTNSDVTKRISGQSFYIRLSIMSAEKIAQIAIKKLIKGKSVIIPGFMNRFNAFVIQMVPVSFRIFVGTSIFKRDFKKKSIHENFNNRSKQPSWIQSDQKTIAS